MHRGASIGTRKAPMDLSTSSIAFIAQSLNVLAEMIEASDAFGQTAPFKNADLDFRHIQLTSVFWCRMQLQALPDTLDLFRRVSFIQASGGMRVKLSKGVTSRTRLQNRTGAFRHIRLLNDRAFVRGTVVPFCVAFIMAMSVERELVTQFFSSSLAFWGDVIHLDMVAISEVKFTPSAFSFLFVKEFAFGSIQQGVFAQSDIPVKQVSIIRTRRSFDFGVAFDHCLIMHPER
jgi:hypothetical protein